MEHKIESVTTYLWTSSKKWHLTIYHLWGLPCNAILALTSLIIVFSAGVPRHHCDVSDNSTIRPWMNYSRDVYDYSYDNTSMFLPSTGNNKFDSCRMYVDKEISEDTVKCSNWTYPDTEYGTTIVTEWNLVCDNDYLGELSQSLYIMGSVLGAALTSLGDTFGRKKVYLAGNAVLVLAGLGTAFAVNYIMFTVMRVLCGVAGYVCIMTGVVAAVELFPAELRTFAGQFMFLYWSFGLMLLDLFAYFIRDWRTLHLVVSLVPLVTIINIWTTPESIQWLLSKNYVQEAEDIVKKAAKFNNVKLDEHPFKIEEKLLDGERNGVKQEPKKELGRKVLFTDPLLRRITIILFCLWFVDNIVYYGLSLAAAELAGDRFLNFFLMSLVEIPATLTVLFVIERIGRRIPLFTFNVTAGIALIALIFVPEKTESGVNLGPLSVFLTLVGKFTIMASYDVIVQYSLELYPTNIRNTGLGTASITAPIAGTLAPFAAYLARIIRWLPGLIFGVLSLFVGILVLLLPETKGRPLPQTVDDMRDWDVPHFFCRTNKEDLAVNEAETLKDAETTTV